MSRCPNCSEYVNRESTSHVSRSCMRNMCVCVCEADTSKSVVAARNDESVCDDTIFNRAASVS